MKLYRVYFFSPELGGIWQETYAYAKNKRDAKSIVKNRYYVSGSKVFVK